MTWNWDYLVPRQVADKQLQWERAREFVRMAEAGLGEVEIRRRTYYYYRGSLFHALSDAYRLIQQSSPVERYCRRDNGDVAWLVHQLRSGAGRLSQVSHSGRDADSQAPNLNWPGPDAPEGWRTVRREGHDHIIERDAG